MAVLVVPIQLSYSCLSGYVLEIFLVFANQVLDHPAELRVADSGHIFHCIERIYDRTQHRLNLSADHGSLLKIDPWLN
jgi:hypothetical protein